MTKNNFSALREVRELEEAMARSQEAPTLLFLHDKWCPISANAYREMSQLVAEDQEKTALIDVTGGKALSRAVEEQTGVRHESPQVIVLRHGKAAWNASHFGITAEAVTTAIAENA
ncbi:MAG TPA: bacillithiol system redox-active protein YtxJ [Thermomicrobiales bacterium]